MSRSTLWKVYKTKVSYYREFPNGHGSAPPVWDWLCDHYLDGKKWYLESNTPELWELYKNWEVPLAMRFGLLVTFDNAIIKPIDLRKAADLAWRVYELTHSFDKVNHWGAICDSYIDLSKSKLGKVQGIALGCTSVSDPWHDFKSRQPFSVFDYLDGAM